jgi:hypothetical protein
MDLSNPYFPFKSLDTRARLSLPNLQSAGYKLLGERTKYTKPLKIQVKPLSASTRTAKIVDHAC